MPCPSHLELNALFQVKGLAKFKPPGQVVDGLFDAADNLLLHPGKLHGVGQHGVKQRFRRVGADDFTLEALLDEFRYAADMVNVGMGEEQVIDLCRLHRP